MNVRKIMIIMIFISGLGFAISKFVSEKFKHGDDKGEHLAGPGSYYTCPMHPQIHADKPGQCPICAMTLIKVFEKEESTEIDESQTHFIVANTKLQNSGIAAIEVERKDISYKIPFSGRFIVNDSFVFQAYESDLGTLRIGLPVTIYPSSRPGKEVFGFVSSLGTFVDPASRTLRVTTSLRKAEKILPETSGSGFVRVELKARIVVPETAILHTGGSNLVYMVSESNEVTPRVVKTGVRSESYYEIISGLEEGELISAGPNFLLDSEAKIRGVND